MAESILSLVTPYNFIDSFWKSQYLIFKKNPGSESVNTNLRFERTTGKL